MKAKQFPKLKTPEEMNKMYDNPFIFVDCLAGFKIHLTVDHTLERGKAKMLMHPEDFASIKNQLKKEE